MPGSASLMQVAASGMLAEQFHMELLSNNIANISTKGFKRTRATFQEVLQALPQPPAGTAQEELGRFGGVIPAGTQRLFTQGALQSSSNPWDLAIDGNGLFAVALPDGGTAYTRDGSFRIDAERQLVTADGHLLQPPIVVPDDAETVHVNPDGSVMVQRTGSAETETIGTITLTRFANPAGLEDIGHNLYQPTDASGMPTEGQAGADGFGEIVGQAREESNVDLSEEMTEMIVAQRAYSLAMRAVQTSDQMLALANELRP